MNLNQLENVKMPLDVAFNGEIVHCQVKPFAATMALLKELSDNATPDTILKFITTVFDSWDIYDGDENLPVTKEVLERCPASFIVALIEAFAAKFCPKKEVFELTKFVRNDASLS